MRISFDSQVDALTLVVSDEPVAQTIEAGDGRLVDLDADGNLVALEILCASEGVRLDDLAEKYNLEPLLRELGQHVQHAREGVRRDAYLRDVLAAR